MGRPKRTVVEVEETQEVATQEAVKTPAPTPKVVGRPYNVYDARANLVAYAEDVETANSELAKFPGGSVRMI